MNLRALRRDKCVAEGLVRRKPVLGIGMRRLLPFLAAACLLTAAIASPIRAQGVNTDICASDDDSAYSPEQRIAACTASIEASKDATAALVTSLVQRGAVYY